MKVKKNNPERTTWCKHILGGVWGWNIEPTVLTRLRENSLDADLAKKEHFPFHQYKNTAVT